MGMFFICKKNIYVFIFLYEKLFTGYLSKFTWPRIELLFENSLVDRNLTLKPLRYNPSHVTRTWLHIHTWLHTLECDCPLSRLYVKYMHKTYKRTGACAVSMTIYGSYHDLHSFPTNHYGITVPRKLVVKAPPWKRRDS